MHPPSSRDSFSFPRRMSFKKAGATRESLKKLLPRERKNGEPKFSIRRFLFLLFNSCLNYLTFTPFFNSVKLAIAVQVSTF